MHRQRGLLLKRLFSLAVLVGSVFGYSQLMTGPLAYLATPPAPSQPPHSLTSLVGELLKWNSPIYPGTLGGGYFFLLFSAVMVVIITIFMRTMSDYLVHSRSGISILETRLTCEMLNPLMTRATVRREQRFHANRSVKAYHMEFRATEPGGTIDRDTFRIKSMIKGTEVTDRARLERLKIPQGATGLVVTEPYQHHLPTNLLATYLPNFLVLQLKNFFRGVIVERQISLDYINEFCGEHPKVQLTSVRYPVTNVVLEISFFSDTAPDEQDIHCDVLRDNIADPVDPVVTTRDGKTLYTFNVGRLYQETVCVHWKNKKLALQAVTAPPPDDGKSPGPKRLGRPSRRRVK